MRSIGSAISSASRSTSRSSSIVSSVRERSGLASISATLTQDEPTVLTQDELISILDIDPVLLQQGNRDIRFNYQKYKACFDAINLWNRKKNNGEIPANATTQMVIVGIFFRKSNWYKIKETFQTVTNFPKMTQWLIQDEEDTADVLSDSEVWGAKKLRYTMKDLNKWYPNQSLPDSGSGSSSEESVQSHKKDKGKGKEVARKLK